MPLYIAYKTSADSEFEAMEVNGKDTISQIKQILLEKIGNPDLNWYLAEAQTEKETIEEAKKYALEHGFKHSSVDDSREATLARLYEYKFAAGISGITFDDVVARWEEETNNTGPELK